MEINKKNSSPSFGALKISKKANQYLSGKSVNFLKRLEQVGDEMKLYKYWDLAVNENGLEVRSVKDKNIVYKYPTVTVYSPYINYLQEEDLTYGIEVNHHAVPSLLLFKENDFEEACSAWEVFRNGDELEKAALLTTTLEKRDLLLADDKEALKNLKLMNRDAYIDNLQTKFGVEETL